MAEDGGGDIASYQNAVMAAAPPPAVAVAPSSSSSRAHDFPKLCWRTKLGYGMGHILNDLCASMWFTYLLLFFHKVLLFDNVSAGIVLFLGQIADGLATTFVGYYSDKGDGFWLCIRFGRRKAWHLIGTVCVLSSFPFIFLRSIDFDSTHVAAKLVYYAAFVIIFQFGWAAVQISHLSMIPDITPCKHERTGLTAIRYAMTVAASITVYLVTWAFLGQGNADGMVGPEDAGAFRNIMLVSVAIGVCSSGLFYAFVRLENNEENRLNGEDGDTSDEDQDGSRRIVRRMQVLDWFKEPNFYQVAGLYMSTRLFVNLSQAYIPLFLQISLRLNASYVAIIPLVMFIFGLLTSSVMKFANRIVGRYWTFAMGCMFAIGGSIWIKAGFPIDATNFSIAAAANSSSSTIFGVAAFVGAGGSTMLITSLSLTADLIARNSESGAFVYGAMSLSDKVSNGVAVVVIQHLIPGDTDACINCRFYFQNVLFYVCGGAALCGFLFMLSLVPFKLGERWRDRQPRSGRLRGAGYESLPGDDSEPQQQQQQGVPRHRQQQPQPRDSDDETARLIN